MRTRIIGVLLVVVGLALGSFALSTAAVADPNLTTIPGHHHYVLTPTGELREVGPRVCEDPSLQNAFNQFHNNIHAVSPAGIGPAAPGLHNSMGGEIRFVSPC